MSTEKLNALQSGMDSKPGRAGDYRARCGRKRMPQIPNNVDSASARFRRFPGRLSTERFSARLRLNCSMTLWPQTKVIGLLRAA